MRLLIFKKILNRSIFRFSSKKTIMEPAQAPEKKAAEPALPNEDDFAKIDIRVGELTEVWKVKIEKKHYIFYFQIAS